MLSFLVMIMSLMSTGYTINRPVYKVVLTQKGFAQFIQYDVDTPPLREFTFCTWIRVYELVNDQTIFSYIAQGNNRVIRLWLDSGGHHIKLSINGKEATSTHVDIVRDVWKHVCLSYQSDFGAWALYIDARLVSCEASQSLYGYVLPGSGSVIIGYGTANNGASNGLEGEIFGANMILKSTIERNVTIRNDPTKRQRHFLKNKLKDYKKSVDYVVLSDLQTDEVQNNFEMSPRIPISNLSQNYIRFSTPNSFIVHKVGSSLADNTQKKLRSHDTTIARDILDFTVNDKELTTFWTVLHKEEPTKFSPQLIEKTTISSLGTVQVPKISEFETPPPLTVSNKNIFFKSSEVKKSAAFQSLYNISEDLGGKTQFGKKGTDEISEVETPPPPDKSNKVYGQWTSSKFANSVLNYLKSINFHKKVYKKVPATIPLTKVLDNFPYASEFKLTKIRPSLQFRKNLIEKRFDSSRAPQINVQIVEANDLRSSISKSHAKTKVKHVEITSRGDSKKNDHRKYRQVNTHQSLDIQNSSEDVHRPKSFSLRDETQKYSLKATLEHSNLLSILPFLKSLEYFVEDSDNTESMRVVNSDDMYSKSLSNRNKWHNVKTYSNDYTPRHINMDSENEHNELKRQIAIENNKSHPSIRLKYKPESRKIVKTDDPVIIKGRELAQEISNQSNSNQESISIIKYNHGYLPGHDKKIKMDDKFHSIISGNTRIISQPGNNFDKHVKLGNALNERHLIGNNEEQKKQSFLGGDESIPDINRYRSDIDNESIAVPPSLGPRICKVIELYERVLYVKPDESIDITNILSPVKLKNVGIEFITQNYKKCSLADSYLEDNQMLYIDWSKTPVRLFGGAYAKTTTDLCGFF